MITIRRAAIADVDAMSDLLVASITALCIEDHQNRPDAVSAWLANKTPAGVRKWFDNPDSRLFVAEHDGAIAAVGGINCRREITLNYVSPEHRFAGISTALLEAMEATLGPGDATLTSTVTAHRFYLAHGWADAGQVEPDHAMVAYRMHKRLA